MEAADGLELDVRLARDGEVVVCHDPTVDRTTDGSGAIASLSAAELGALDAGYHFSAGDGSRPFRGKGIGIPTLREIVSRYREQRLIVEIKEDNRALVHGVLDVLRAADGLERTCLGSFHLAALEEARRLEQRVVTSAAQREVRWALYRSWVGLFPRTTPYAAVQVPERREATQVVTPRFIRAAHRAGVEVQVWVVDEPADIQRLLSWGVDALITDRPDVAVPITRQFRAGNTFSTM
jgi:glycerophosphoryl diester phosphodiesterase